MKKSLHPLIISLFVVCFFLGFCILPGTNGAVSACEEDSANCISESASDSNVESISLSAGNNGAVSWTIDGNSPSGFKVVWSKNTNPTYPCREDDQYHYYSESDKRSDNFSSDDAFDGAGTYYVRVCEYLGGKCGVYSNEVDITLAEKAEQDETGSAHSTGLTEITLSGEGSNIKWAANGSAAYGYKVVWSKNTAPTYPTRPGDTYHYLSNPGAASDFITPFDGNGAYYVRVCEYRGGECGIYSNQISVNLANAEAKGVKQIEEMREAASDLYNNRLDTLLSKVDELKSIIKEQQVQISYLLDLKDGLVQAISTAMETAINNFIAYGVDDNTKNLGEGERAAVMYSFKEAFGKLPETESELEEAIKIANGRFPSIVSEEAENQAKAQFKKIYLRDADMNNSHDAAAIKVMAYGLRQKAENRNLHSEAAALRTFRAIFKKMPQTTEEWNALQAITYSGATR